MRISFKTLACGVAAFVVGLIALTGLSSALSNVTISYGVSQTVSENGFDVFDFKSLFLEGSNREWAVYVAGAISILSCLVGVVTMVFGVLSVMFNKYEKVAKKLMIVSLICSFLYMVFGIIYNLQVKAVGGTDATEMGISIEYTTSAFVPFIFAVLFTVAYFVCQKMVPDKYVYGVSNEADGEAPEKNEAQSEVAATYSAPTAGAKMSEERKVEVLAKYSQLLKDGVITQEEFDAKKKEIL